MKLSLVTLTLLMLTGCTTMGQRESSVTLPNGEVYRVMCQSEGTVEYKAAGVEIRVDNKKRAGIFEGLASVMAMVFARSPEIVTD